MLFHAYLPSPGVCLASVCRQLFLPGSDSQTNNEGQLEFYVSTLKVSYKIPATVKRAAGFGGWCPGGPSASALFVSHI